MLNDWIDKMTKQRVTNVLNSIEMFKKKKDGTYNIKTGKDVEYLNGFQVSFVRPEAFEQLNHDDWDNITNYFCEFFNSDAHIGVYCGSAEVSFHSISCEKAINTMVKYNQQSMLDWDKKNKYPDSMDAWLIMNKFYDEGVMIRYEEIFNEIQ